MKKTRFYFLMGMLLSLALGATAQADDERSADYDLEVDTPGAFGLALKGGVHWNFTNSWALTLDGDVGQVYNSYAVKDRQSDMSDDLSSPHYHGNLSFGISVAF